MLSVFYLYKSMEDRYCSTFHFLSMLLCRYLETGSLVDMLLYTEYRSGRSGTYRRLDLLWTLELVAVPDNLKLK